MNPTKKNESFILIDDRNFRGLLFLNSSLCLEATHFRFQKQNLIGLQNDKFRKFGNELTAA